jgi:hypothetical protein
MSSTPSACGLENARRCERAVDCDVPVTRGGVAIAFAIVDGHRALEIGTPGPMRQRLNQLILDGHKRATAGLLLDYVREDEELESEGELLSLVDDEDRRVATVRVADVATVPFIVRGGARHLGFVRGAVR